MADSDNTTTLPFVTRRRKKRIVVFNPAVPAVSARMRGDSAEADPAVALSLRWRAAQARSLVLCRRQQRLETMLMRRVGPTIPEGAGTEAMAHAARWRRMDNELGHSRAREAEERAARAAAKLFEELGATPARPLDGVVAKLDTVLREARTRDGESDLPWSALRFLLADLKRLVQAARHEASPREGTEPMSG